MFQSNLISLVPRWSRAGKPRHGDGDWCDRSLLMIASRCRWLAVLLLVVVPAAVAAGDSAESSDAPQSGEEAPEWARKLYGDPPEFKVFKVAGHRFRVPYKYSRQSSEKDPLFQMSVLWPTLDPYWTDKPQPRDREDFDTLQVTVRGLSPEQYMRRLEGQQWYSNQVHQSGEASPEELERVHDLWHIKGKSTYVSFDPVEIWSVKQHIVIRCGSTNCYTGYMPLENVNVHVRFDPTIFPDWQNLIENINSLLKGYKEE